MTFGYGFRRYIKPRYVVLPPFQVTVKRTWRERLFSRPWRPLQTTRYEYQECLKDGEVLCNDSKQTIYMNAKTHAIFMQSIGSASNE